jgi:hypothetical protein
MNRQRQPQSLAICVDAYHRTSFDLMKVVEKNPRTQAHGVFFAVLRRHQETETGNLHIPAREDRRIQALHRAIRRWTPLLYRDFQSHQEGATRARCLLWTVDDSHDPAFTTTSLHPDFCLLPLFAGVSIRPLMVEAEKGLALPGDEIPQSFAFRRGMLKGVGVYRPNARSTVQLKHPKTLAAILSGADADCVASRFQCRLLTRTPHGCPLEPRTVLRSGRGFSSTTPLGDWPSP